MQENKAYARAPKGLDFIYWEQLSKTKWIKIVTQNNFYKMLEMGIHISLLTLMVHLYW